MGRPEDCNCCGVDVVPPITSCDDVICIAFIDENNNSNGKDTADAKFAEWVQAFPNRILFVVDVYKRDPNFPDGTPKLYFPDGWNDHNYAFNLRGEFQRGVSVPEFCNRDNGDTGVRTDVWAALSTIVTDRGLTTDFNNATEVSVFVDVSKSMPEGTVLAAYDLLVNELESAGKTLVSSIYNEEEDYLCPFVTSSCCPNEFAEPLQVLCQVTPTCEPATWSLTNRSIINNVAVRGRTNFLIREYIDYTPPTDPSDEDWQSTYGGVEQIMKEQWGVSSASLRETYEQELIVRGNVFSSNGIALDFVDVEWKVYYSDDDGTSFTEIGTVGTSKSGEDFSLNLIVDNYGGDSSLLTTTHDWLGATVDDFEDVQWGSRPLAVERKFDRLFKIEGTVLDPSITSKLSLEFTMHEYRHPYIQPEPPPPPPNSSVFTVEIDLPINNFLNSYYETYELEYLQGAAPQEAVSQRPRSSIANVVTQRQLERQYIRTAEIFGNTRIMSRSGSFFVSKDELIHEISPFPNQQFALPWKMRIESRNALGNRVDVPGRMIGQFRILLKLTQFDWDTGAAGNWNTSFRYDSAQTPSLRNTPFFYSKNIIIYDESINSGSVLETNDDIRTYGTSERRQDSFFGGVDALKNSCLALTSIRGLYPRLKRSLIDSSPVGTPPWDYFLDTTRGDGAVGADPSVERGRDEVYGSERHDGSNRRTIFYNEVNSDGASNQPGGSYTPLYSWTAFAKINDLFDIMPNGLFNELRYIDNIPSNAAVQILPLFTLSGQNQYSWFGNCNQDYGALLGVRTGLDMSQDVQDLYGGQDVHWTFIASSELVSTSLYRLAYQPDRPLDTYGINVAGSWTLRTYESPNFNPTIILLPRGTTDPSTGFWTNQLRIENCF